MPIPFLAFLVIAIPAGCLVLAALPVIALPRFRPALLGASGSGCVGIAATTIGLLASGFVQVPGFATSVLADDKPAETAVTKEVVEKPLEEAKAKTSSDIELEVAEDTIEIPPGRPKWVGKEPNTHGKIHTIAVASGPYAKDEQSRRALNEAIVKATNEYIAEQTGSELAPQLIRYDARSIRKRFVKPENTYHDVARYSVGWMHENFVLLEFGPEFRKELDQRWAKVRASSRLAQTGLVSGSVLLLLGSVFGYFRLDNATRGYYTGRLQFMTAAAILTVVGAGAVVAQWIHWL